MADGAPSSLAATCGARTLFAASDLWLTGCGMLDGRVGGAHRVVEALPPALGGVQMAAPRAWERDDEFEAAHIPARPDRRAMGLQFATGVCAADMALEAAGLGPNDRSDVGLYVATRMAERDEDLDRRLHEQGEPGEALNRAIMSGLRPTMFLAQLPNLLAGNLAIVTHVRGVSRTFVGEEMAGANAFWAASRDLLADRAAAALVGGAVNGHRESLLRWMHASGYGARPGAPALADTPERGVSLGTAAAFAVLQRPAGEPCEGAAPVAIRCLRPLRSQRADGATRVALLREIHEAARGIAPGGPMWILANTQGAPDSQEEIEVLRDLTEPDGALLFSADLVGSALEADMAAGVCLAVEALSSRPLGAVVRDTPPASVLVLTFGLEDGVGGALIWSAR